MRKYILATIMFFFANGVAVSAATDKTEKLMFITGMIIQNSRLVYDDIFLYTKPGITRYGALEGNPVAASFWKTGDWNLGYFAAVASQVLGNGLAYRIDPSGKLNWVINAAITCGELWAISTWSSENLPEIDYRVTALVVRF
jgi:hypothetical protein